MRPTVKDTARHYLNPLHVYCRLTPILGRRAAGRLARLYEKVLWSVV